MIEASTIRRAADAAVAQFAGLDEVERGVARIEVAAALLGDLLEVVDALKRRADIPGLLRVHSAVQDARQTLAELGSAAGARA